MEKSLTRTAIVFVDMLRSDWRLQSEASSMIKLLNRYNSRISFENYFATSPDTPRSISEFLTGTPSSENGVNSRFKWPRYYLHNSIPTIFEKIQSHSVKTFAVIDEVRLDTGLITDKDILSFEKIIDWQAYSEDAGRQFNNLDETSITFFDITDFHASVDYWRGTHRSWKGLNAVANKLSSILDNGFDDIILFSDHGCLLSSDKNSNKDFGNIDCRHRITFEYYSKVQCGNNIISITEMGTMCDVHNLITKIVDLNLEERCELIVNYKSEKQSIIIADYLKMSASFKPDIFRIIDEDIDVLLNHKVVRFLRTKGDFQLKNYKEITQEHDLNDIIRFHVTQKQRYLNLKHEMLKGKKANLIMRFLILPTELVRKLRDFKRLI